MEKEVLMTRLVALGLCHSSSGFGWIESFLRFQIQRFGHKFEAESKFCINNKRDLGVSHQAFISCQIKHLQLGLSVDIKF